MAKFRVTIIPALIHEEYKDEEIDGVEPDVDKNGNLLFYDMKSAYPTIGYHESIWKMFKEVKNKQ